MADKKQPSPPEDSDVIARAGEVRRKAMERSRAEDSTLSETGPVQDPPAGPAVSPAELESYRDQLRDYEKALVERIADVDDDRRATETRLQRAWQTQREDVDERLKRGAGLMGGLLMLFVVLFAVALFLVYRQATIGQPDLAEEVSEIRGELAQFAGGSVVDPLVREKLERLTAEVGEGVPALEQLVRDGEQATQASLAAERADREQTEDALAEEIRNLGAEQGRLAEALESLRSAVQTQEAVRAEELAEAAAAQADEADEASEAAAPVVAEEPAETDAAAAKADEASEAAASVPVEEPAEADGAAAKADEASEAAASLPAAEAAQPEPVAEAPEASAVVGKQDAGPADEESDAGVSGSEETLAAAEGSYALQLIGFYDRKSLDLFLAREGLPARAYYIRQTFKGRPWYAVIHSLHEDYAEAEEELSRLPAELLALNPWIRPLSKDTELRIIETGPER